MIKKLICKLMAHSLKDDFLIAKNVDFSGGKYAESPRYSVTIGCKGDKKCIRCGLMIPLFGKPYYRVK